MVTKKVILLLMCYNVKGFPRRRGDGPREESTTPQMTSFPPQARGWTLFGGSLRTMVRVSPAGAGMDRSNNIHPAELMGFPRRRGDGPR